MTKIIQFLREIWKVSHKILANPSVWRWTLFNRNITFLSKSGKNL